ncbi:colanic acid biosynthesis glycosyltransferase WcaL [Aliishimia ponticola]|uniref:Colanic acid biosynthesis glycosyltransferase WcaL n=1 Tax=Aliishimia ponticola TaxID=2499833 RepID=A0A4S4NGC6_9RHOB|nr:glycosyltransferase family 4 protein [Aliishimia ponticola]THH35110.1 colanic acid biosynthesis glycosyltransferase WcaL [Aliishimia ponticola]
MTGPKLAIVVKGWPRLSETFIAQELVALEAAGLAFDIWSLRHPTDKKRHPLHDKVTGAVHYLPEYLHDEPGRVWTAWRKARRLPGYAAARAMFLRDLYRDFSRNRVRRFGQACVMAADLPDGTAGLYAHFLHTPASVTRYAAVMRGLPWAYSAHAKDIWTSVDWDLSEKLRAGPGAAAWGATCTALGARHLRQIAGNPGAVDLVYHGLDLSRFPDPPERPLRAPDAPLHMVSVGRLVEKKGFDRLIDAFALLPRDLDWHWTHIGGGTLSESLKARAEAAGLSRRITWRGACDQPEVIEAMRAADLFVLPSRVASDGDRDGLPNVLMEAASQRLPILSTPVSSIPEFIETGTHGLLSEDTPEALAAAIERIARHPEEAELWANAAYDRLREEFLMAPGIAQLETRLRAMIA